MYCEECGAKCKKDELFCAECGAPLQKEEPPKKEKKTEKKPMSKGKKRACILIAFVVAALVIAYCILNNQLSPKTIAKNFVDAIASSDSDKLYKYLDLGDDQTFTSKKIFAELMDGEDQEVDIENYKVTNVTYGDGNLSASVTIAYTSKGSSSEKTTTIPLIKSKNKKWLVFDEWKINFSGTNSMVVKDFKLYVPKDSKVTYADISVDQKYKDAKSSTDEKDCYVLPQVFPAETEIKIALKDGLTLEDTVTPSSYRTSYTANISLDMIRDEDQTKIKDTIKGNLTTIYNGVLQNKAFQDIKGDLKISSEKEKDIQSEYESLVEDLKESSNTLTAISFTNVTLSRVEFDDNGELEFRAKVEYKYSIKYSYSGSERTKDSSDSSYVNLAYHLQDGNYQLVDIDNLVDYFSRY